MPRGVVTAAASALLLGGCTVGPNFHAPRWASPASWFAGEPRQARAEPSEAVAAPIDAEWWSLFRDPHLTQLERHVAASNLDVRAAAFRVLESRAQLGVTRAGLLPTIDANGSYERSKPSNKGEFSLLAGGPTAGSQGTEANGAFGNTAGGVPNPPNFPAFDVFQYRTRCDMGARFLRPCPSLDRVRGGNAHRRRVGAAGSIDFGAGGGGTRLHRAPRHPGAAAHRPRECGYRAAGAQPDPPAGDGRRHHRPRCRQRLGAARVHRGADPDLGGAGTPACQCAFVAARAATERVARRVVGTASGAAGAAPRARRLPLGAGPPPSRHPRGGGAASRCHRECRRRGRRLLSVRHPERELRVSGHRAAVPGL